MGYTKANMNTGKHLDKQWSFLPKAFSTHEHTKNTSFAQNVMSTWLKIYAAWFVFV